MMFRRPGWTVSFQTAYKIEAFPYIKSVNDPDFWASLVMC